MKKNYCFLLLFLLICAGFGGSAYRPAQERAFKKDKDLERLYSYLAGSFNSSEQARQDSDYYDIHLHMKPIWVKRNIGYWLYVEQASASALQRPYRQRVYHLVRKGDQLVSEVYTLNTPLRFAGAYKEETPLEKLTVDSLLLRDGCEIVLSKKGKSFIGKTGDKTCNSDLRGAAYASSEVEISAKELLSWDRGFDKDGKQVWGATKGGYLFKKVALFPVK